ncbi:hypothetical protein [Nodosilinea nodulosa]|uniref:hypothetical protein n=1 Tax=Nodosilinea nodulosa TaxID=416001 RepID=UPI000307BF83|nr:hypothetical protein [Nodosilinea nodulosa]
MLSSLLSQFRQRYPQGSLTSELLTIHDGLYVVQVCAGVDGTTLASGLGANTALEAAEDGATARALERLGLSAVTPASPGKTSGPQPLGPDPLASAAAPSPQPEPALLTAETDAALPPQPTSPRGKLPLAQPAPELELPLAVSTLDFPPVAMAIPPLPKLPAQAKDEASDALNAPADEFITLGAEPGVSIDLSDIIAQTDVELQRLGWGVNQGREFLEKTYGKRSRHDLTDDELLEFLLFLETQSAPGD